MALRTYAAARLRRAQALAFQNGAALTIARELIRQKLAGQERLVRDLLHDPVSADAISRFRADLAEADSPDGVRILESRAAATYWDCWRDLPVTFPRQDLKRVPEHWRTFGTRKSPLTGSPRRAVTPPGAILNYCYALLESESRLAAAALGLDPGIGMLHVDTPNRDSLACDIMEAVRPSVDAWILNWIIREPLRRSDFFETREGNCRLMSALAVKLSETATIWGRQVAPFAEYVGRTLWTTANARVRPATHLTQSHRREAKGALLSPAAKGTPRPESVCRDCGTQIRHGRRYCASCAQTTSRERMVDVAQRGRETAHTPEARARRVDAKRRHDLARRNWSPSNQPEWLTEETYAQEIQPRLASLSNSAIALALGVSVYYAIEIRRGKRLPHPRHWQELAKLVGVAGN